MVLVYVFLLSNQLPRNNNLLSLNSVSVDKDILTGGRTKDADVPFSS